MTSSTKHPYSETDEERRLRLRTFILEESYKNQRKAHEYMEQHKYNEALYLLNNVLRVRRQCVDVKPSICCLDVASVHLDIGLILKEIHHHAAARCHLFHAWMYHYNFYGPDHEMTNQTKRMWFEITFSSVIVRFEDELCHTAAAA